MIDHLACLIVAYAVNSLWGVPLAGVAGWLASKLARRISPKAEHKVWVGALLLGVVMPAMPLCQRLLGDIASWGGSGETLSITMAPAEGFISLPKGVVFLPTAAIVVLLALYLCSVIWFAIRLLGSCYWISRLLRDAGAVAMDGEQKSTWNRCLAVFGVEGAVLQSSRKVPVPMTVGVLAPVVLLPEGFISQCVLDDLLTTLSHECAHMERRDFRKNLFYEAVSIAIAFHPVTWMLKSQVAQSREMVCDAMVVERMIAPHRYSQSLLRLASLLISGSRASTFYAIGIFDANILEKRIMSMTTKRRSAGAAMRLGLMIPGALLFLGAAAGGAVLTLGVDQRQTPAQTANGSKPYGEVYAIGKDVKAPALISSAEPEFPKSQRKSKERFEGICVIKMIVDKSGVPQEVHVTRSLGPDFDKNAIEAVQQYRFTPATRLGEPVAVALSVEVNFKRF